MLLKSLWSSLRTRRLQSVSEDLPQVRGGTISSVPAAADGAYEGWIEELSAVHVQGWARDLSNPGARVSIEVFMPETGEILASGRADQFVHGLAASGIGDGAHGFWTRLARPLTEAEQPVAAVRVAGTGHNLHRSNALRTVYEPLWHVAMDVVDNCNLRCPFCLYDYENTRTTHFMSPETLDSALRFLPYARDGEFWFSCLHEPTLHPQLVDFIERVPRDYRRKLFFTTNLAKRMPVAYFDWLAGNGMHHINVSIESRDPAIYERMRKGARFRIFQANWDLLMGALQRASTPTPIRYIAMAYKSNLREIPELTRYLLEERRASHVELRYTFDVAHLPPAFRAQEFLDPADWDWLARELAGLPAGSVSLLRPPAVFDQAAEPALVETAEPDAVLPGRAMFRLSWDGALRVVAVSAASRYDTVIERTLLETNIRDIGDPALFFDTLMAQPRALAPA